MIRHKVLIEGSYNRNTREIFLAKNQHYSLPICRRWGQHLLSWFNGPAEIQIASSRRIARTFIKDEVGRIRVRLIRKRDYCTVRLLNNFDEPEVFMPIGLSQVIFGTYLKELKAHKGIDLVIRAFQKNVVYHFYGTERS